QAGQLASQLIEFWRSELHELVANRPEDPSAIAQVVAAIEATLPVLKSHWPELALEAVLVRLAAGSIEPIETPRLSSSPRAVAGPAATTPPPTTPTATNTNPAAADAPVITSRPTPAASATKPAATIPNNELWIKALTQIKQHNNSLYALLRSSTAVEFGDGELTLGCRFTFHRDRLQEAKNVQIIETALARVYGRKFRLNVQLETKPAAPAPDASNELVSSALEILGGEVIHE
ncbi:MAG TPA: hypothetical protein VMR75_00200, partial [Candidatus Saccharimonadales bacterium]|nr:hypothetical protein [Candidatus Saccharimonadales bacterium]